MVEEKSEQDSTDLPKSLASKPADTNFPTVEPEVESLPQPEEKQENLPKEAPTITYNDIIEAYPVQKSSKPKKAKGKKKLKKKLKKKPKKKTKKKTGKKGIKNLRAIMKMKKFFKKRLGIKKKSKKQNPQVLSLDQVRD